MLIGSALITSATFLSPGHDFSNNIRGITTEIEGIKLDAVIMERKFNLITDQNKLSTDKLKMQLSNLEAITIREHDEIKRSEHELASTKERCKQLEGDIQKLLRGRNMEIADLNKTIVLLQNKIKASEALSGSVRDEITCINLNKPKQCAGPLETHIPNPSSCEKINREKSYILIRLYPSDQQNSKAKCQASNLPKLVERQTSLHTRKSNNESSDSDVIIISNNDTLTPDLVIAPSTLKLPCILALPLTPVIKKHAQFENCVITPNVHVTQQRPEL